MENACRCHLTQSLRAHEWLPAISCGVLLFLSSAMVQSVVGAPSSSDCDPGLKQPEGNPSNAYAQRQGRCEGIYVREIAGANLGVASYAALLDGVDPKAGGTIRLQWNTPAPTAVHLRAVSLKPRFFYRMDASRPAGDDSWLWPTDVLNVLDIDKASLGIVATATIPLNGIDRVLYLPLRVSSTGAMQASHPYKILLRSDVELSEVFVSIAEVDKQGKPITYLRQNKPLLYGIYPPERGIPISIGPSELRENAIYQVDVGATLRTGGSANIKFWIYGGV